MATPVAASKFEVKSHDSPDETRTPSKTRVEVGRLEGYTIGRFNFEPGWRWPECVKPVVGTDSCQNSHVGYAVTGQITVRLNEGATQRGCDSTRVLDNFEHLLEGSGLLTSILVAAPHVTILLTSRERLNLQEE